MEMRRRRHTRLMPPETTSPINPRIRSRKTSSDRPSARRRASAGSNRQPLDSQSSIAASKPAGVGSAYVSPTASIDGLGHAPAPERDHGHRRRRGPRWERSRNPRHPGRAGPGSAGNARESRHPAASPGTAPSSRPSPRAALVRALRRSRSAAGLTACRRRPPGRCACKEQAPRRRDKHRCAGRVIGRECRTRRPPEAGSPGCRAGNSARSALAPSPRSRRSATPGWPSRDPSA